MGIGTTARLTLYGDRLSKVKEGVKVDPKDPQLVKEPDGSYWTRDWSKRDLNDGAEWRAHNDGIVYHFEGLVEGLKEGKTSFTAARYPLSKGKPLEAPVAAAVAKIEFTKLELGIDPLPVLLGQGSKLHIDAGSKAGKKYSVLESSRLALRVDPPNLAKLYGTLIEGRLVGKGKLVATFRQAAGKPLSSTLDFEVTPGGIDRLVVSPEQIEMVVGEIADLTVLSPYSAPIKITSTKPDVVEVTKENRLVGRAEGAAKVEVVQGKEIREVAVNVAAAKILSLALKPSAVSVPVGQTAPIRALGTIEGDRVVELSPDFLKLDKKPAPQYAEVDPGTLAVRGVSPTTAPSIWR